jgi:hypothetical protein
VVLADCGEDVRDDLPGAILLGCQVPVDGRHTARARRVGVTVAAVQAAQFAWQVEHDAAGAGD